MLQRIKTGLRAFTLAMRTGVLWDAAGSGNRLKLWAAPGASPNSYYDNPTSMRSKAEGEFRNNPYARKVVKSLVNAAWGANAVNPHFKSKAAQQKWERWTRRCDAAGRMDWVGFGALLLQTVIVSGEAFVVLTIDPEASGNPLRLLLLGPEYLDTSRSDRTTYGGIQYAGLKPAGYWLYRQNPALTAVMPESTFVSAENCLHLFQPITPGAQRGQTWLAPVLLALRELQEYLEASLVKAKVSALFAGFVRTPNGGNPMLNASGAPVLEPGTMTRLQPEEEVTFSEPPDAGATFDPFVRAQLRRIASGMAIPYEILSGDLSAVTFASGRHGLLEYKRTIESIQYGLLVPQFCIPVMQRWLQIGEALGEVESADEPARWIGPTIEMLDPRMETAAQVQRVRAGFTSRSEVVSASGWRVEDVDEELARDNARADGLGLVLDTDPRKVTQQGQEQAGGQAA